VLELRHKDAAIFEPFCEQEFMAGVVRDVLVGGLDTVEEIKDEVAARFSAGLTRRPWREQWNQLIRLQVGLSKKDEAEPWFGSLDEYFEMRNCIIHRQARVSRLLRQKTPYFDQRGIDKIEIWPQHLDFYRGRFLNCLEFLEARIAARYSSSAGSN